MEPSCVRLGLAAALAASLSHAAACARLVGPPSGGNSVAEASLLEALEASFAEEGRATLAARKRSADWHVGALLELRLWCEGHEPALPRTVWCSTWSAMGPEGDLPVQLHWECSWDGSTLHARVRWCDPPQPFDCLDFPVWPVGLELSFDGGIVGVEQVSGGVIPSPRDCRLLAEIPFQPIGDAYDIFDAASHWWRMASIQRTQWLPMRLVPPQSIPIESAWSLWGARGHQRMSARLRVCDGWLVSLATRRRDGCWTRHSLVGSRPGGLTPVAEFRVDAVEWDTDGLLRGDPLASERRRWPLEACLASQPDGGRAGREALHRIGLAPAMSEPAPHPAVDPPDGARESSAPESAARLEPDSPPATVDMVLEQVRVLHEEVRFWHRVGGHQMAIEVASLTHQAWSSDGGAGGR